MRSAALGLLLTALVANCSQAAFITLEAESTAAKPSSKASVQYAVFQNQGAEAAAYPGFGNPADPTSVSPVVASGSYLYVYQTGRVTLSDINLSSNVTLNVPPSMFDGGWGTIRGVVFASSNTFKNAPTKTTNTISSTVDSVTFSFEGLYANRSEAIYFVSKHAPAPGTGFLGTGSRMASFTAPVATPATAPLPPAMALLLAGAPFAGFIRRRKRPHRL